MNTEELRKSLFSAPKNGYCTLTPEQRVLLESYDTALDTLGAERERERFSEGFRMGVRLGAECFGE